VIAAPFFALEDDHRGECGNLVSGSRSGNAAADDENVRSVGNVGAQDVCACAIRVEGFMV